MSDQFQGGDPNFRPPLQPAFQLPPSADTYTPDRPAAPAVAGRTRQETAADEHAKQAQVEADARRQKAADDAEAAEKKRQEDAAKLAEYNAQPRVRLQAVLTSLNAQHSDVRDHLGMLSRAVHFLAMILHEAAPEVKPLKPEDEADGEGH